MEILLSEKNQLKNPLQLNTVMEKNNHVLSVITNLLIVYSQFEAAHICRTELHRRASLAIGRIHIPMISCKKVKKHMI